MGSSAWLLHLSCENFHDCLGQGVAKRSLDKRQSGDSVDVSQ